MENKKYLLLQLFAEGEGEGDGAQGNEPGANTNEPVSFDDFLKGEGNQAEFDRRVQKAINTALDNAKKKWETLTSNKVTEAEKLAQMTAEEKEKYRADKAEKELADLRKQIALGDMAKTARKMLSDEEVSIPDEIIMNIISEDAEKTKANVEAFTKSFKDAVQAAVKEALRGNPPKKGSSAGGITREQILAIADPDERRQKMKENFELFS